MKKIFLGMLILMTIAATSNAAVIPGSFITADAETENATRGPAKEMLGTNGILSLTDPNGWSFTHTNHLPGATWDYPANSGLAPQWYTDTADTTPFAGQWLTFTFAPGVKRVHAVKIWNWNWSAYLTSGVRNVAITVKDRDQGVVDVGARVIAQATGNATSDYGQIIGLDDGVDRPDVVTFTMGNPANWGGTRMGISKVRFAGEYLYAGPDQTVELSLAGTLLQGAVTYAGSATWTKVSGPGTADFVDAGDLETAVVFSAPGVYVLQLTDNVDANIYDQVTITVTYEVEAGPNQTTSLTANQAVVQLAGVCSSSSIQWSVDSGPASVTFSNLGALDSTATFTVMGQYILRLTDGDYGYYDTVKIVVNPEGYAPGLIGYWPLDGNAADAIYGNDGIVHGAPQYVEGKVGQAVKFDGASGIEIPNEWFFEGVTSPEMTVTFWAKIPYGARPEGVVVGKKDFTLNTGDSFRGRGWGLDSAAAVRDSFIILLGFTDLGDRRSVGYSNTNFTYDTHNDGKWRHFAVSIDASGNASYYIDGVYKGIDGEFTIANMTNDTPLSFGFSASFPGGRNWAGYLDEVRFYNVTLTEAQVNALIADDDGTCTTKVLGDINGDCKVNLKDFALLASEWLLDCTYPNCP